ncbi:Inward rectifier potassium channel Kirbac3.1 [Durusdinium trenchii]|uniref:Inward rectifier potassium channel Kirbac3.1 n=1 Tax=Durusdinium trenchii TaxID=1381693 RepID=A0ABP0KD46_9DINO
MPWYGFGRPALGRGRTDFPVQYDLSGRVDVVVKGSRTQVIGDCAFFLLRTTWSKFMFCLLSTYLSVIFIFGMLFFYVQEDGILCLVKDEPCTFWDGLNLSTHCMSTIGFGTVVPNTAFTNALVIAEFWIAVLMGATAGGLLFSRVSTASSRVAFSDVALVTDVRGTPTITFRIVNERPFSCLFDVTCRVSALVKDPKAGMRILAPCKLERATNMMFRAVWNLLHRLDEESPICGLNSENCQEKFLAFVVQLEGTDQTYMQKVFANKCYYPSDFRFDETFDDIMTMSPNKITVDLKGLSNTSKVKRADETAAQSFTLLAQEAAKLKNKETGADNQEEHEDKDALGAQDDDDDDDDDDDESDFNTSRI